MSFRWYYPDQVQRYISERVMLSKSRTPVMLHTSLILTLAKACPFFFSLVYTPPLSGVWALISIVSIPPSTPSFVASQIIKIQETSLNGRRHRSRLVRFLHLGFLYRNLRTGLDLVQMTEPIVL